MTNKIAWLVLVAGVPMFFLTTAAEAFVVKSGDTVTVTKGEVINETLLIAGQSITIDADINGDVICAGQMIQINGAVNGDVICAGQTITVANSVTGSVRAAGQTIRITGNTGRNVTVAGQAIDLASPEVGGEVLFASQQARLAGAIARNVAGAANSINVGGKIGGNAQFGAGSLTIGRDAVIGGTLDYTSDKEAAREDGSRVIGSIARHTPRTDTGMPEKERDFRENKIAGDIGELFFRIVMALILVRFFNKYTFKAVEPMLAKFWPSLGWGLVVLILTPVIAVAFALTIIGIPATLLIILLYAVAILFSMIFAAIAVGKKIGETYFKDGNFPLWARAATGVVLLWFLSLIPVIGFISCAFFTIWGLGGIFYSFRKTAPGISNG